MPDVAVAYNRYKFLGYEFLTWLWCLTEKNQERLRKLDAELLSLVIGNRIVLENRVGDTAETITIKGEDADLDEGRLSLKKGAVVIELNLIYRSDEQEWHFTIKGESFNIANLRTPATGTPESEKDIEGAVLEKVWFYEKVSNLVDTLFNDFMKLRISKDWDGVAVPELRKWIHGSTDFAEV